ncbi:hypothetical protein [Streptomyces sp. NPDC093970]|uniref:hypothetical protein n=1 Tax=Streptomyces sp. NPDC093970 TaxID=3155076 RepID=UPI003434B542
MWALVSIAGLLALQVALQDEPVTGSWTTRLIPAAPVPFIVYVIWRVCLNPYVSFGPDRLRVNNMFTRYLVPYHLITETEGRSALSLVVSGYGRLPVAAIGAAPLTGRRKRDAVARELLRRRAAAAPRAGHGFEKHATIGLPEWLGPGLSLAGALVALSAAALGG